MTSWERRLGGEFLLRLGALALVVAWVAFLARVTRDGGEISESLRSAVRVVGLGLPLLAAVAVAWTVRRLATGGRLLTDVAGGLSHLHLRRGLLLCAVLALLVHGVAELLTGAVASHSPVAASRWHVEEGSPTLWAAPLPNGGERLVALASHPDAEEPRAVASAAERDSLERHLPLPRVLLLVGAVLAAGLVAFLVPTTRRGPTFVLLALGLPPLALGAVWVAVLSWRAAPALPWLAAAWGLALVASLVLLDRRLHHTGVRLA